MAVLRSIPNLTIIDIGDATEIESVLPIADDVNGPVYIRMLRKDVPRLFPADEPMELNKGRLLSSGTDITIFSSSVCTEEAMRATKVLEEKGLSIQHVHISTLKPFTDPLVVESLKKAKYGVVTIENHTTIGGLGDAVSSVAAENGLSVRINKVGINDTYTHGASKMYLMKKYGLDAMTLIKAIEDLTGQHYDSKETDLEEVRFVDYSAV